MIIKENVAEAARSLYTSKQRTALALLGIIIGIGSVITSVSIGKIAQGEALRQFVTMGVDVLTISTQQPDRLKLGDVVPIPKHADLTLEVAPYAKWSQSTGVIYGGKQIKETSALGVTQNFPYFFKLKLAGGRYLSDLDALTNFCYIGSELNDEMRKISAQDVVGAKINIGESLFTVIGVIEKAPMGMRLSADANRTVFFHIKTLQKLNPDFDIDQVKARVKKDASHNVAIAEIKRYFASRTKLAQVKVESPVEIVEQMKKQMDLFTLLLGAIASISLVVGGVGIMNVMLVSVSERRKEIGIRRALGARQGDIKTQFLIESVILSSLGGLLGVMIGVSASYIFSIVVEWSFALSYQAIIMGVGVSAIVGIFFGFYPAVQASRLDPIVALRSD